MHMLVIALLAIVQGAAELLPISSSAHVILLEKIFGLDPTSPEMTFLLVMLHTGTMIAVLVYFWSRWSRLLSRQNSERWTFVRMLVAATIATGVVGLGLQVVIEHFVLAGRSGAAVEDIFGNSWIIATGLAAVGVLIICAGFLRGSSGKVPPSQRCHVARCPDRGCPGPGAPLSRVLALGLHDFGRAFDPPDPRLFGRAQLCPGRDPDDPRCRA